jgi:hypothetical protein
MSLSFRCGRRQLKLRAHRAAPAIDSYLDPKLLDQEIIDTYNVVGAAD